MAPIDRYRAAEDMPDRIALFPLSGVILLPRADLPLNVFEPRYLAMVDDVLAGSRIIGIVQPETTAGTRESPAGKAVDLKRIGCAGRLTAYQELADGRMHITLSGVARFTVVQEIENAMTPYRMAEVSYQAWDGDFAPDTTTDEVDRGSLLEIIKVYLASRRLQADWDAVGRAPLEPLINGLSLMSPFGPEEKQALLQAVTLKDRADVLRALAEMAIAGGGRGDGGRLQ